MLFQYRSTLLVTASVVLFLVGILPLEAESRAEKSSMVTDRQMGASGYATHMAALITAVVNTNGPVLELGCGDFSTPLLHAICGVSGRYLLSAESNLQWMSLFCDLVTEKHDFLLVKDVDDWNNIGQDRHWSVVFVDHAPGKRRVVDIRRLRNNAEIFVIHDTEDSYYGYEPLLSSFKYKHVYKRYSITTTVVSDSIDVAKLFEEKRKVNVIENNIIYIKCREVGDLLNLAHQTHNKDNVLQPFYDMKSAFEKIGYDVRMSTDGINFDDVQKILSFDVRSFKHCSSKKISTREACFIFMGAVNSSA